MLKADRVRQRAGHSSGAERPPQSHDERNVEEVRVLQRLQQHRGDLSSFSLVFIEANKHTVT